MGLSPFSFDEDAVLSVSKASNPSDMELQAFSQEVISEMIKEGVPPLPSNFQSYFDILLEDKPESIKRYVRDLKEESGENNLLEHSIEVEKKFLSTISHTKELLQNIADIYQHISAIGTKITNKLDKTKGSTDPKKTLDMAGEILTDWKRFIDFFKAEALKLNELYTQNIKLLRQAESESIYDPVYHLYNGRYVVQRLTAAICDVQRYGHSTTFLSMCMKGSTLNVIGSEKKLALINKTVAKLLDKTSRKSDVIGYMGQGTFSIILHHTTMDNASKAATRIIAMLEDSNFFIDDRQLVPQVNIGLYPLTSNVGADEVISLAYEAMKSCDHGDKSNFKIVATEK